MISHFLANFPEKFKPNEQQVDIIQQIEAAFTGGSKFVICSAPTGSGKSFVSKTLANVSNEPTSTFKDYVNTYEAYKMDQAGSFVYEQECKDELPAGAFALTITKTLQDQYKSIFDDTAILKGKSNYQCEVDPNYDVDTAPCIHTRHIRDDCWKKNICPYYNARNNSLTSKFSALNYNMFLALPNHVKYRDYIICDEASELEDEIVKQFSATIDIKKLRSFKVKIFPLSSTSPATVRTWINTIRADVTEHTNDLHNNMKKKAGLTQSEKGKLQYLKNIHRTLTLIDETWQTCEYVVQIVDRDNIKLTPLKVNTLTNYIFKYADKVLLMSATIIDHKNLAKTLGITDYKYIESGSGFDPKKAPIYISQTNKLNHANLQKALPSIVKQIDAICAKHKDEKGIIHTHTNSITSFIKNGTTINNRFLYRDKMYKNEEILKIHEESQNPTVLVSPSLGLGVDLKGDLARFQIIVKAAYLPLGDDRIKKMFNQDKQWYANKMLSNFIQQCGRGIRSKDDYCVTYVLDANIFNAVLRNKSKLPKYFLERFV
jgi:Rad3-related DNA helicase